MAKAIKNKKKTTKKAASKKPIKKAAPKKISKKVSPKKLTFPVPIIRRRHTIYIESAAFLASSSEYGHVDVFQDGRHTEVPGHSLQTPIVLPVGATLQSISIHYSNSTDNNPMAVFLRKHADRFCPSGEIEMSFINLVPGGDYLTVTDNSFPDGGVIQDRYLHYLDIHGTGDFGESGRITVRGVSLVYEY